MSASEKCKQLLTLLQSKIGQQIVEADTDINHATISISPENMLDVFQILKLDTELAFNLLSSVTVVDWLDEREERFEVVYHLVSINHHHRLRVKINVSEDKPEVASLCELWSSANYMEREAWDMYGVEFKGHPDLRRVLMYDEFEGHPLRKDYPVQGKQPRIKLRHPEVRNTASDMIRADLVTINPKHKTNLEGGG